jgi:2,4-dienoyl-CoA reductase-like NADH-dependent reductase (Old Yellow Enzyme family)
LSSLFQPFRLKSLALANRLVMAPMTRNCSPEGVPNDEVAAYYARRAEGGAGLIISEGTVVNRPASAHNRNVPHFHGEAALRGWKNVLGRVHEAGGRMAPQLWHVGVVATDDPNWRPAGPFEGPSGLSAFGRQNGTAMTTADIEATVAAFAQAAADAQALGFDALEVHAAHGYLIDQFFWPHTNRRTDGYGGKTIAERARFAVEIVRAVRARVGPEFVISLRVSQWKLGDFAARLAVTPEQLEEWLAPLAEAGVDILHCSQRRFWEAEFAGSDLNFAGWVKKVTGRPTITVGAVGLSEEFMASFQGESAMPTPLDELLRRLERGDFDLVAVGRPLLADPHWVRKIGEGRTDDLRGFRKEDLATLW